MNKIRIGSVFLLFMNLWSFFLLNQGLNLKGKSASAFELISENSEKKLNCNGTYTGSVKIKNKSLYVQIEGIDRRDLTPYVLVKPLTSGLRLPVYFDINPEKRGLIILPKS